MHCLEFITLFEFRFLFRFSMIICEKDKKDPKKVLRGKDEHL